MTKEEIEGAKKLIENKDVKKGSYSFIGDSNITYADINALLDYIKQLEKENKKYKETVDKTIHLLDQFDAWLEPQEFLKIKKIEKVLEEVNK